MPAGTIAAIAGIVAAASAAAGAGYTLSGAGQPQQPNLASASEQMSKTQAELLPILRQMQAAAELGQSGSVEVPAHQEQQQFVRVPEVIETLPGSTTPIPSSRTKLVPYVASEWAKGGKYAALGEKPQIVNKMVKVGPGPMGYDFSGLSQADIQGTIAKALAQGQLDLSKKYDAEFIQSALDQEKLADPQSVEARAKLYDLIQQQIKNPPQSPVSEEMQRQVQQRVAAGSGLTPDEQAMLDEAVMSGSAARGGGGPAGDFSNDLTTGFAGERRALGNAEAGTSWLSSGETPEDIQYRSEQQNLANLSNFVAGKTPESEFAQLSGAQAGPTPMAGNPQLPGMNFNAGQQGASGALQRYGAQVGQALNQPNQWMAGISGVLGALGTAGAAGYRPLATQNQMATI